MVQDLLAAKRDLKLRGCLKKIPDIEVLILDDMGYVQQSREEMEVLFSAAGGAVRARQRDADEQPAVLGMGGDLQGPDDDGGGDRPLGAPQRDPGVERAELPRSSRLNGVTRRRPSPGSTTPSPATENQKTDEQYHSTKPATSATGRRPRCSGAKKRGDRRTVAVRQTVASKEGRETGIVIVAQGKCSCRRSRRRQPVSASRKRVHRVAV